MTKATLAELEAVEAVSRTGGFRAAARDLGTSSSALSHAVAALEGRLGVRLFNRTTRSVALSAAGETFVAEVSPALAAIRSALEHADLHRGAPSGTLRLNMTASAARELMAPLILEYCRRYPQVEVEIATDNALVDITGLGFDAGVRLSELLPPDMIAVPITPTVRSVVVGSPAYFEAFGEPETPGDLARHRAVRARMRSGKIYRWEFERHGETLEIDAPGQLILDDGAAILEAALHGAGLAFLHETTVAPYVETGRLRRVLTDWTPPYPGLSLYFAGRRHMPGRLRALIELIKDVQGGEIATSARAR